MQNLYTDLTVVFKLVLFDSLKLYLSDVETNLATFFESPRVNSVNFSIVKFERRKQKSRKAIPRKENQSTLNNLKLTGQQATPTSSPNEEKKEKQEKSNQLREPLHQSVS